MSKGLSISDQTYRLIVLAILTIGVLLDLVFGGPMVDLFALLQGAGFDGSFLARWFFIILGTLALLTIGAVKNKKMPKWTKWVVMALVSLLIVDFYGTTIKNWWAGNDTPVVLTDEELEVAIMVTEQQAAIAAAAEVKVSIYDSVKLPRCGGETDWVEVEDKMGYRLYWDYTDNIVVTQYLWNGRWLATLDGLSDKEIGDIEAVRFCTNEFYYVGKEMGIEYEPILEV